MVMLASRTGMPVYNVFDQQGRQIGQVVEPRSDRVVGRGEGTVLLLRTPKA